MKIAIPTRDGRVDDHFGHCDHYTIFEIEQGAIVAISEMPSPEGCGCKSGIAPILSAAGVEIMLAGNMGDGAKNVLAKSGIKSVRGCSGDIEQLIIDYLAGKIEDSGEHCDHHDCPSEGEKTDYKTLTLSL